MVVCATDVSLSFGSSAFEKRGEAQERQPSYSGNFAAEKLPAKASSGLAIR